MTYDELNALLEAVANEPTNDVLMLENFDKIRNYVKEAIDKMASMVEELDKAKADYDKLRESKVKDFFNRTDDESEEIKEETKEEIKEESDESDITISDLFDDDVEVEDLEIKKEEE